MHIETLNVFFIGLPFVGRFLMAFLIKLIAMKTLNAKRKRKNVLRRKTRLSD